MRLEARNTETVMAAPSSSQWEENASHATVKIPVSLVPYPSLGPTPPLPPEPPPQKEICYLFCFFGINSPFFAGFCREPQVAFFISSPKVYLRQPYVTQAISGFNFLPSPASLPPNLSVRFFYSSERVEKAESRRRSAPFPGLFSSSRAARAPPVAPADGGEVELL